MVVVGYLGSGVLWLMMLQAELQLVVVVQFV